MFIDINYLLLYLLTTWSRGMIPALGAGGPGFESPRGPYYFYYNFRYILCCL